MQKRSIPFLAVIGLFGMGLGFLVSSLDPFIYNEKVRLLAPPGFRNTALGFITIMALLMALVVQLIVGRWSDQSRSRWGRRQPYLVVGAVGVSFALILVVMADGLTVLVIGAMLVSTFSNTTQAAWQALIPDQVPEQQHGTAAGVKTILELIGVVTGVAIAGMMLSQGNLWGAPLIAIGLFFAILLITLYTLHRSTGSGEPKKELESDKNLALVLLKTLRSADPAFYWWIANRFLFWSSAIAIRTFLLNYLEDVLGLSASEAQALGSRLFILLGIGVFILALPAGIIADRIGRRPILITAGLMAATGTIIFVIWPVLEILFVAGALIAVGAGIFASASWALATDLAPKGEGATYLALANGATVLGSMGGRLGGPLIDGLNQIFDTIVVGYIVVFAIAGLFFIGSSLVVLKIRESK